MSRVRFATKPGSFILTLALPRRVTNRMAAVARNAQLLADAVSSGDEPLRVFGRLGRDVPNATELEALSGLGGSERSSYRLRFAQTPLLPRARDAILLQVTPGQQRIMAEAAAYLRSEQPRIDVTVKGVVLRLSVCLLRPWWWLRPSLDLTEESAINTDVFHGSYRGENTQLILLEQPAQAVAVDQVNRRGAVPGRFLLGVCGERSGSDQKSFVATSCHGTTEVADGTWANTAAVALALEEHREAD